MEANETKQVKRVDNSNYRERFQFVVSVNDNIICQRYFKINRFNSECLNSKELFEVLDGYKGSKQELHEYGDSQQIGVVQLIQRDLEDKSRVYLDCMFNAKTQATGFAVGSEPTFIEAPAKEWDENEFAKPWEVVFKFEFLVDDKVVYHRMWDGSQYPRYVRNSVDLTNSRSQYPLLQYMNQGRQDLVVEIIKRICAVTSDAEDENGERIPNKYTKSEFYTNDEQFVSATNNNDDNTHYTLWENVGGVLKPVGVHEKTAEQLHSMPKQTVSADGYTKYAFNAYNKEYVNQWRKWCSEKYGYHYAN